MTIIQPTTSTFEELTTPIINEDGLWVPCRDTCGYTATHLAPDFGIYNVEKGCKTRGHEEGAVAKATEDLQHLRRVFFEPVCATDEPRLWVACFDATNGAMKSQLTSRKSTQKRDGQWVEAATLRRHDSVVAVLVATVDLSTRDIYGEWVPRETAYANARTWLHLPGVKAIYFTRDGRWTRKEREHFSEKLIPGHLAAHDVKFELSEMGVTKPVPDEATGKISYRRRMEYRSEILEAADRVRKRLQRGL